MKNLPLSLIFFLIISTAFSQDAQLGLFTGIVYDLPYNELKLGFHDRLKYFDVLGEVKMKELNIPSSNDQTALFPGVHVKNRFGIVFDNTLTISRDGCYEFHLESDDGSRLWINGKQVINNDGPHRMRAVKDTSRMLPGEYTLKLWYYSAYPMYYGLIFNVNTLPDSVCHKRRSEDPNKLTIQSVLFEFDSYELNDAGKQELNRIAEILKSKFPFKKITIVGHTDAKGTHDYNMLLSKRRAQAVLNHLKSKLSLQVEYIATGKGSTQPLTPSTDESAMQLNRRVEIFIE